MVEASEIPVSIPVELIDNATSTVGEMAASYPITIEQYVRSYFVKTPILAEIARCESHFIQYEKSGTVLRGKVIREDVGIMQINERYHLAEAQKLGFNIYTLEGNLGYAKQLYDRQGTSPWSASAPCWGSRQIALSR